MVFAEPGLPGDILLVAELAGEGVLGADGVDGVLLVRSGRAGAGRAGPPPGTRASSESCGSRFLQ